MGLTIAPKCIAQELEEMMANPNLDIVTNSQPCGNCFVCKGSCHGKPFRRQGIEKLLFSVLGVKEGIEGEITADNITTEIRKREKECKDAFNIKKPIVGDVEATLLVLIAAGLIECVFKNEEEEENE